MFLLHALLSPEMYECIRFKIPWQIYIVISSHFESIDIIMYCIEPPIEGKQGTSKTWDAHGTYVFTHGKS